MEVKPYKIVLLFLFTTMLAACGGGGGETVNCTVKDGITSCPFTGEEPTFKYCEWNNDPWFHYHWFDFAHYHPQGEWRCLYEDGRSETNPELQPPNPFK